MEIRPLHQKHPKLTRPDIGHYARAEFSFVGTTCERIDGLLKELSAELSAYRVLTVTGDHGAPLAGESRQLGTKQFLGSETTWNEYDDRMLGRNYHLALVNGNHFPAAKQVVFVDPKKAGTLERRKEQLTNVVAIVMCPGATEIPAFLEGARTEQQCMLEQSKESLLPLLTAAANEALPPLKALILAGGQSSRMGEDKSRLMYRDKVTEMERMITMCQSCGLDTYLSMADAEDAPTSSAKGCYQDRFLGMGPMGAIATAFLNEPDTAWLVLACDLPLLEASTVQQLIDARDPSKLSTAVKAAENPFPEPLVAIYEPRAYPRLLEFLSMGYACPRKMLINSDVKHLEIHDTTPLTNANTPEEREAVLRSLGESL